MRKNIFIILFFLLLFIYIVFFPRRLSQELVFLPSWGLDSEVLSEKLYSDDAVPFYLDSGLGYYSPAGQLLYREDVTFGAAVSDDVFINYFENSGYLVLQKQSGEIITFIDTEGYPFFISERLFVISPDRMVISEYDQSGTELLRISPGSVVTSVDASESSLILGMLNGEVAVYTDDSEPDFTYFSTDSRYSIAYACALSDDGMRFAAVTGLYPQQLVCFEFRNDEYIPVFRMDIKDSFRRNMILDYSSDGKLLFVESAGGLDLFSTATFLKQPIEIAGNVTDAVFPAVNELSYVMASGSNENLLKIYRADLGRVADFKFPGGDIYFYPAGGCFYVGVDGRIFRYDIVEG